MAPAPGLTRGQVSSKTPCVRRHSRASGDGDLTTHKAASLSWLRESCARVSGGGGRRDCPPPWGIHLALARPRRLAGRGGQRHLLSGFPARELPSRDSRAPAPCEGVRRASREGACSRNAPPGWALPGGRAACLCAGKSARLLLERLEVLGRRDPPRAAPYRHRTPLVSGLAGRPRLRLCPGLLRHSLAWALPPAALLVTVVHRLALLWLPGRTASPARIPLSGGLSATFLGSPACPSSQMDIVEMGARSALGFTFGPSPSRSVRQRRHLRPEAP